MVYTGVKFMKRLRVLYVEDYPIIQKLYLDTLKKHFTVDAAGDGNTALELTHKHDYDLVIVDLLLPTVNGIEFLKAYRKQGGKAKVIVLTDFEDDESHEQIEKLNVDHFWIKAEHTPHFLLERILNQFPDNK